MDPAQFESLVQRLVANPHDADALAQAHHAGQHDPTGYAALLERAGAGSADPFFSAHWFNEAAMVWQSLGDNAQCGRLLQAAAERDPSNVGAVDRAAQLYKEAGNYPALAQLLERMCSAVRPMLQSQPELRPQLLAAHEELAGMYTSGPVADTEGSLRHWAALAELDPQNVYAIYQAREQYKACQMWAQAVPLFAAEQAVVTVPERKAALYRDEIEVCRAGGDLAGVTRCLRELVRLAPDDANLSYELACSVIERIDARGVADAADRDEAGRTMVRFAETYEGEHAFMYACSALKAIPGDDRALQLADYHGEQLGRQRELVAAYRAYLGANPQGYMSQKAQHVLAALGEPAMAQSQIVAPPSVAGAPSPALSGAVPPRAEAPSATPSSALPSAQDVASSYAGYPAQAQQQPAVAQPAMAQAAPAQADATEPQAAGGIPQLLEQAKRDADAKRMPQAHDLYRRVLEAHPAHPEALGFVEDFLRQRRKFDELCDVLMVAARDASQSVDTRKAQLVDVAGICESKLKNLDRAIDAWKQLCQIDRGDAQARERLVGLLEKQKRWDELAPMLEQQAMNASDTEEKLAVERRLAQLHEKERNDLPAAAETWLRIVSLAPGDAEAVGMAVDLYERAGQPDQAAQVITGALNDAQDSTQKAALIERLGELRLKLGDAGGAADSWAEAAELLGKDELWQKAGQAYRDAGRWADVAHVLLNRAQQKEGKERAALLAEAASALLEAGNPAAALAQLEAATDLDPTDETLAGRVEEHYQRESRHEDHIAFLLRRSEKLEDKAQRVLVRHRAAAIQRSVGDEAGARATLEQLLADGEDLPALQLLFQMAEQRQEWSEAVDLCKRIVEETQGDDRLAYAVRAAQLLAEGTQDIDGAIAMYQRVLADLDPNNAYSMHEIAELELRRNNPSGAAVAMERLVAALAPLPDMAERRIDVARRLSELYEGPLGDMQGALRLLEVIHAAEPEDFDAVGRLMRLSEKLEDWPRVALLLAKLIEVEGDEEEASNMTRQLATLYVDRLGKGDEALAALERLADQGDMPCQEAYADLGIRLGWKGIVATKLCAWNESATGSSRTLALRRAFELFLEVDRKADARTVALELARAKEADEEVAQRLEGIAVELHDLEAIGVAHDILARNHSGAARAEELVRQAEVMLRAGADPLDAIQHGELALNSVEPVEARQLLLRLSALTDAPGHVIDLYERQVLRCKRPNDRVEALAMAALIAAQCGAIDRARDFFNTALSGGVHESTLALLEQAARDADASSGGGGRLVRTLAEALAAGGQGSRDGGRTRSALLRRAAQIAHRELGDLDAAFSWLSDAIVAHVDDATLDALDQLGAEVGDLRRVETAISKALEEVYDGPLVRKLLAKRAELRRGPLADMQGAADDLKKLHDLSPGDQELTKALSQLLTELGNHRGMIELYEDQILRGRQPHIRAELARKVAMLWEESIGDAREAADAWRRVLRMKAGDKEAMAGLERCKSGKVKKAPPVPAAPAPAGPEGWQAQSPQAAHTGPAQHAAPPVAPPPPVPYAPAPPMVAPPAMHAPPAQDTHARQPQPGPEDDPYAELRAAAAAAQQEQQTAPPVSVRPPAIVSRSQPPHSQPPRSQPPTPRSQPPLSQPPRSVRTPPPPPRSLPPGAGTTSVPPPPRAPAEMVPAPPPVSQAFDDGASDVSTFDGDPPRGGTGYGYSQTEEASVPQAPAGYDAPQGEPPQVYPPQVYPPQADPQQGDPQQGDPQQGDPQQGHPQQGHPQQGYPAQEYPAQEYSAQAGYPQEGYSPQAGYAQPSYPQEGYPQPYDQQAYVPQGAYAQQGYDPSQYAPQYPQSDAEYSGYANVAPPSEYPDGAAQATAKPGPPAQGEDEAIDLDADVLEVVDEDPKP
jgi:hypothetical protein